MAVTSVAAVVALVGALVMWQQYLASSRLASRQTIIQVTPDGFIPSTIIVKAGAQVVWKNTDSAPRVVASNPYPENSSVPELNSRTILPGGSYTYTPAKSGLIEYHDNTRPTLGGTITVQ